MIPRATDYVCISLSTSHCTTPTALHYPALTCGKLRRVGNTKLSPYAHLFRRGCIAVSAHRSHEEHCAQQHAQPCTDCRVSRSPHPASDQRHDQERARANEDARAQAAGGLHPAIGLDQRVDARALASVVGGHDGRVLSGLGFVVSVALWGLRSCPSNQARGNSRRRVQNREHVFPGVHQKAGLELPLKPCGRARPRPSSRCAAGFPSAPQSSGYRVSASPLTKFSWSCWTRSADGRGFESRAKATKGKAASTGMAQKSPAPLGLRVGEPARPGRLSWPAQGRTSNVSERGVAAGETALNSQLKLPCVVRAGAPAEINVRSFPSPMQGGRTWDQPRGLTNGDSLVLQPRLTGRGLLRQCRHEFSSGDGLGIHEPGSNTRGGSSYATAPSGRARNRAMCPAVARSFSRRAA